MFKTLTFILMIVLADAGTAQIQKPSSGKIDLIKNFKSAYVTQRNIEIWLPEGYTKDKKYSVLYMHDGQMLYDSTTTWNKQSWEMDDTAAGMMKKGEVADFIIVGIWNDNATRHIDYFPQKPYESLTAGQKDTINLKLQEQGKPKPDFKPNSDNYLKFIVKEVKPFIDSVYSVYTDKSHTFVAGSSMGGLISMYAVTQYPNIFGGAACISTHWPGIAQWHKSPIPSAFGNYLKENLKNLKGNKIYFDIGDRTLDALYPPLQKMVNEVMLNYPITLWKSMYFPGKDHSERSWQERVNVWLKFLLGK